MNEVKQLRKAIDELGIQICKVLRIDILIKHIERIINRLRGKENGKLDK